ncbi:triosephosphate isomerase 2 [Pseudovirgaria hyperparasitica]|uniref:Triosephosphate isomerase n=1 Tax=Pseudovirgaria hyperparasitica TaxID=470096 RepID=A0A6A6WLQ2_9PEZI|nr:triosephosphate isomerase 2 [Pseudovirgaria hyperparasitica]KAF2763150.1 triosephosphate isomerase 2 [Pseudovirgaria hyperparasitica]
MKATLLLSHPRAAYFIGPQSLILLRQHLSISRISPPFLSVPEDQHSKIISLHPIGMVPHKRRIVGTSLKMYFDLHRTQEYIEGIAKLDKDAQEVDVDLFVIPDFLSVCTAVEILKDTNVMVGVQDSYWEDAGAHTGEVSPLNIKQAGASLVELGHAERRARFGETDETTARKVTAATRNGLTPLVCIGEKERGASASQSVGTAIAECEKQVKAILAAAPDDSDLILAYEPVWAIGAAKPADADHVVYVTKAIRHMVANRKGRTRILYGGSAGPGTYKALADGVDGLFLGRFAHDLQNLKRVIEEVGRGK